MGDAAAVVVVVIVIVVVVVGVIVRSVELFGSLRSKIASPVRNVTKNAQSNIIPDIMQVNIVFSLICPLPPFTLAERKRDAANDLLKHLITVQG